MHDLIKKAKGGDRESIALILLDAPDRQKPNKDESPEDYAMSYVKDKEEKMDPLKQSILDTLDPLDLPESLQVAVCEAVYKGIKGGDISKGSDDHGDEKNDNPEEKEEAPY